MNEARLTRSETDKMLAGVCGGLAAHLGIDPVLVRLAFVVLFLASGIGLAIYVILWIVMPSASQSQPIIRIAGEQPDPDDPSAYKPRANQAATVGIILILFGAFFMLNQVGWMHNAIWPIVLIAAGVFYLVRRGR